jgi:long-chain acyl-CoA synthetase
MTSVEGRTYAANPAELRRGTLSELFFEAVQLDLSDALRVKRGEGWQSTSHRELQEDVRAGALAIEASGVRRGDRVAIITENRPEWPVADFACLCSGVIDVPIYATLPSDQIAYIMRDCGARMIFVSTAEQLAKIEEIRNQLPALEKVVVFDDVPVDGQRALTLKQFLEIGRKAIGAGRGADFKEKALQAKPDDLATILYTSGTTGQPKGVMLSHNNIFSNTQAVRDILPVGQQDVALSFLPLSHIFQRMVDYFLFWRGCRIAYVSQIDDVGQAMQEQRPTIVVAVPRVFEKIYGRVMSVTGPRAKLVAWAAHVGDAWARAKLEDRQPPAGVRIRYAIADRLVFSKLRARTGGRVRTFVSGSAPLNATVGLFFFGAGLPILEGYGLTETSPVTNVNLRTKIKFGSVGPPVPGTEVRIAEDGEILIRGPQVMLGYYNMPDATREVIDEEGWFHTGDIGEIDADGYLRITDRKKELIVTAGGKNVAPAPMENMMRTNNYVTEAVVVGDRRPYPIVLVVPNFDVLEGWAAGQGIATKDRSALIADERVRQLMEKEVLGAVNSFARYERPKKVALLEREFTIERGELTPTMKVKRRIVEKAYADRIEALYADSEQVTAG